MNEKISNSVKIKVLIVDDVPANLKMLRDILTPEGYRVLVASDGQSAINIAKETLPDIILLDVMMPPGMNGFEVCRVLKQDSSTEHIPVIFITVKDDTTNLTEGFRVGGVDYITKPFSKEELLARVETHLKIGRLTHQLLQKNRELQAEISRREQAEEERQKADEQLSRISQQEASRWGIEGFVGKSKTIRNILDGIRRLHQTGATNVLIMGESGTGKELIARAIHFGGSRANAPFIPINCSAVPGELAESTFFGHVKGAFSGANASHKGCFELADGGTLFLDEIGDMPLEMQPKLLRVIDDGRVTPVGGTQAKQVDVGIITATNQDLLKKSADGRFREDLYFRLARFPVVVPPLRERTEDIPLLAEHFLEMFSEEIGIEKPVLSPKTIEALMSYSFPGNVRELKNIIERALIESDVPELQPKHLHLIRFNTTQDEGASALDLPMNLQQVEAIVIKRALEHTNGNMSAAAQSLGINRTKLYRKIAQLESVSQTQ